MMKFRSIVLALALLLTLLTPLAGFGATTPAYTNRTNIRVPQVQTNAPQIDATIFVNEAHFEVNDFLNLFPLPYETMNTLHFVNDTAGTMAGTPGYRWTYYRPNLNSRSMMANWMNRGTITTETTPGSNVFFITSTPTPQWLLISATNIFNSGLLNAGEQSLIQITGKTVNLARSRIRTGGSTNRTFFSGGAWLLSTNDYSNDPGITDVYWGLGTNNVVSGTGMDMQLNTPGLYPSFVPPIYNSAMHDVIQQFGTFRFTNTWWLTLFEGGTRVAAHRTQNPANGGDSVVQVVFVRTNSFDTNLTVDVRFVNDADGGSTAVVAFHAIERDVVYDRDTLNSVFLLDALAFQTNASLSRNFAGVTRRPNTYEVTKGLSPFLLTNDLIFQRPNSTNAELYKAAYLSNSVPVTYAAYSANVSSLSAAGGVSDPTDLPGRVEILADTLNLRETRIRADSTLILKANNLISNNLARINAPFVYFDAGAAQPMVISNLVPPSVTRLSGNISAWSAIWDNAEVVSLPSGTTVTNNVRFHVLFVDHTLNASQPVAINQFKARAPDIVIHDRLSVRQQLRLEAGGVHVKSNAALIFPPSSDWTASSMVNIYNFTNDGLVSVPGPAFVGSDRGFDYSNFINRGTNIADTWSIRADNFANPGCMVAQAGPFVLNADVAALRGRPPIVTTNIFFDFTVFPGQWVTQLVVHAAGKISAITDVSISSLFITLSNTHLLAGVSGSPGAVILTPTTRLKDAGTAHTNYLITSGGVRVMQRPSDGDLMGTYALVKAPPFAEAQCIWPASDLGVTPLGFSNNLALGKLTLDGGEESTIRLAGLASKTALYVDYLELLNNATNYAGDNPRVIVDPSLKVYFAHSNLDASKLNDAQKGFRWVKSFMGPLSTTNIVYPSGNVYPMNISLARDTDIDSDGDGIANSRDRTPLFVAESVGLRIAQNPAQPTQVLLSWQAMANSTSYVEYRPLLASTGPWQLLRFTTAPSNMRITVPDSAVGPQRIYRVRVDLPPQ